MKSFVRMSYPYILWIGLFIVAPMFMILLYAVTSDGSETVSFRFTHRQAAARLTHTRPGTA